MYCIYCGKEISNDSIFCTYCGFEQKLRSTHNLIKSKIPSYKSDSFNKYHSLYKEVNSEIAKIYKDNGFQVILSDIKIKRYNVDYFYKFLPVENKNILSISNIIIEKYKLDGINIRLSNKVENLVIITIPLNFSR